ATCDNLPADRVFELINTYSKFLIERLAQNGGIVDNIIGDEIVCFFTGKSQSDTEYVKNSLDALTSIFNELKDFESELHRRGFPTLNFGIGVNFGEASLGTVGAESKVNFTALGKTVNIASRLQSIC